MNSVTIVMAYYDNPTMLVEQYAHLAALTNDLWPYVRYIVVDDCSPRWPASLPNPGLRLNVPVEIYRMREDIPWNQDACRNLGVERAPKGWVLLTDMDHVPSKQLLTRVITDTELDGKCIYKFARVNAPDFDAYKQHPNSWLMTKAMYDKIGGYDERYRGIYGTDGMFASNCERCCNGVINLPEPLIRYPREVIADASTTTLFRKGPENDELRRLKKKEVAGNPHGPRRGLMGWDRVYTGAVGLGEK